MHKNYDYIFKFVIVGSPSVGKSSILQRFADDQFQQSYISTIGIDFRFKSLMIDDNYVKLQIWDTAGQQRFRGITKSYYKGAHAVILVYDITNPKSFEDIQAFWLSQSKVNIDNGYIYLMRNKCDSQQQHKLREQQAEFIKQKEIKYYNVSAKTGANVNNAILSIAKQMMSIFPKQQQHKTNMGLKQVNNRKESNKCCSK